MVEVRLLQQRLDLLAVPRPGVPQSGQRTRRENAQLLSVAAPERLSREDPTCASLNRAPEGDAARQVKPDNRVSGWPDLRPSDGVEVVAIDDPPLGVQNTIPGLHDELAQIRRHPPGVPPERIQFDMFGAERRSDNSSKSALSRAGPTDDHDSLHPLKARPGYPKTTAPGTEWGATYRRPCVTARRSYRRSAWTSSSWIGAPRSEWLP